MADSTIRQRFTKLDACRIAGRQRIAGRIEAAPIAVVVARSRRAPAARENRGGKGQGY